MNRLEQSIDSFSFFFIWLHGGWNPPDKRNADIHGSVFWRYEFRFFVSVKKNGDKGCPKIKCHFSCLHFSLGWKRILNFSAHLDTIFILCTIICHIWDVLQHVAEQAEAMKKNGVAIQCIIHNPLAKAPIASDLLVKLNLWTFVLNGLRIALIKNFDILNIFFSVNSNVVPSIF